MRFSCAAAACAGLAVLGLGLCGPSSKPIGAGAQAFAAPLPQAPAEVVSHLIWFDRTGKRLSLVDSPANERGLELSPDGARATVSLLTAARRTRDIWMVDMKSGMRSRFTDDAGDK